MAAINITWPKKDKGSVYKVSNACSPVPNACEATFEELTTALGEATSQVEHTDQFHDIELPPAEDHVGA